MKIVNQHQRSLKAPAELIGSLIDSLASEEDQLWPWQRWPRMKFDRALSVGAKGGHGPIGYVVEDYIPGNRIVFRFTNPKGFDGFHRFNLIHEQNICWLQHRLEMNTRGFARISWPLIYRPLHDALIEDSLATAQLNLHQQPDIYRWSLWVKFLRWLLTKGNAKTQSIQSTAN